MALLYGINEAKERLMKEVNERNPGNVEYPKATNNRGYEGGSEDHQEQTGEKAIRTTSRPNHHHHHDNREHHAMGDSVGYHSEPGMRKQTPMKKGGHPKHCHADGEQPGEHMMHKKHGEHMRKMHKHK